MIDSQHLDYLTMDPIKLTFLALLLQILYLFVPGYLIVCLFRFNRNVFLFSFANSLLFLVFSQIPFRLTGGSVLSWLVFIHGLILIGALITLHNHIKRGRCCHTGYRPWNFTKFRGSLILVTGFTVYHSIVGPYTEIPSDYWEHLARVNEILHGLKESTFLWEKVPLQRLVFEPDYYYFFLALLAYVLGTTTLAITPTVTLVNSLIFLLTVFLFTIRLLRDFQFSPNMKVIAGLLASALIVVTFGTATFSYIRYYAFFPTIVAFPLMYLSIVIVLDYLEIENLSARRLTLLLPLLAGIALIHTQEALFACILIVGTSFIRAIRTFSPYSHFTHRQLVRSRSLAGILLATSLLAVLLILLWAEPNPIGPSPHIKAFTTFFSQSIVIHIATPSFRFWDTLGFFGLLAYLLFVIRWKEFSQLDFVVFGMISPLFTHLNPFYAHLFFHWAAPSTLWRTSYLVPTSIAVAVFITVTLNERINKELHRTRNTASLLLCILALTIAIWPIKTGELFNRTSKAPSLISVGARSGAGLWNDLIDEVSRVTQTRKIKGVVTDTVTQFVLDAAVFGKTPKRDSLQYFPASNSNYQGDLLFSDFSQHLLIVNLRDGDVTESARFAGHWPKDALSTSKLYPSDILEFSFANPEKFIPIWRKDSIFIFLIQPPLN